MKSPEERFFKHVYRSPGGCWTWTAAKVRNRYGKFFMGFREDGGQILVYAHRWSYEYHVGPIPDGLQIDHLCRNPPCVNPAHLEAVTLQENMARTRQTECHQGHEYEGFKRNGRNACRACDRINAAALRAKRATDSRVA